jgi:hypothetical protein
MKKENVSAVEVTMHQAWQENLSQRSLMRVAILSKKGFPLLKATPKLT